MPNSVIEHQLDQLLFWEEEAQRCDNPIYYIDNYCRNGQELQIVLRPSVRIAMGKLKRPLIYTNILEAETKGMTLRPGGPFIYQDHEVPKSLITFGNINLNWEDPKNWYTLFKPNPIFHGPFENF